MIRPGETYVLDGEIMEVVSTFAGGTLVTLRPPASPGASPTRYRPATRTVNARDLPERTDPK